MSQKEVSLLSFVKPDNNCEVYIEKAITMYCKWAINNPLEDTI